MSRGIRRTLLFMRFGTLDFTAVLASPELLAAPTAAAIAAANEAADAAGAAPAHDVLVSAIDPGLADTAAFCAHYEISMADGANWPSSASRLKVGEAVICSLLFCCAFDALFSKYCYNSLVRRLPSNF